MKLNRHPHAAPTLEDVPPKPIALVPPPPPPPPPQSANRKVSGAARPNAPESARPSIRYTTQKRRSLPDNSAKAPGAPAAKPSSAGAPARKIVSTVGVMPGRRRQNAAARGKTTREESGPEQEGEAKAGWSEPPDLGSSAHTPSNCNPETVPPATAALDPKPLVQPTESPVQPSQSRLQPAQFTQPTQPSAPSTQPSAPSTQASVQPTPPSVQPTPPSVQPTPPAQSSAQPTQSVLQPALAADPDRLAPVFPHRSRTFIGGPPPNLGPRSRSLMRSVPPSPSPWAPDFHGAAQPPASKAFVPLHRRSQSSLNQRAARSNSLPLTDLPGRSRTFIEVRNNRQLVGDDYVLRHRPVPVPVNPRSFGRVSGNEFLQ